MKKIKLTAKSAVIINTAPGTEVGALVHEGIVYFPAFTLPEAGDDSGEEDAPARATKPAAAPPARATKPEKSAPAAKAAPAGDLPSLAEMKKMALPDLVALAEENGIDLDALKAEHKVTRWSNVTLSKALDTAFADLDSGAEEDAPAPEMKARKGGKADSTNKQFVRILNELDSQDIEEEDAERQLGNLLDDDDAAAAIVSAFMEDTKADAEALYERYEAGEFTESKKKAAPAARGKAAPAKPVGKKKEATVEVEDLNEGDRVEVYWDDQEDWFPGEVVGFEGDMPIIAYDDDTESTYDPELSSKIRREAE
jgi:hypothetical protein